MKVYGAHGSSLPNNLPLSLTLPSPPVPPRAKSALSWELSRYRIIELLNYRLVERSIFELLNYRSVCTVESFYGSRPQIFFKQNRRFQKPTPGRISLNTVFDTLTSSIVRPLHTRRMDTFLVNIILPCVEQPWNIRSFKKIAGFLGGGYRSKNQSVSY